MHSEESARRRNASLMNAIGAHEVHPSVGPKGLSIAVLAAGIIWALCVPYTVSAQTGFNGPSITVRNNEPIDARQTDGRVFSERTIEMGAADGGFNRDGPRYYDPNR